MRIEAIDFARKIPIAVEVADGTIARIDEIPFRDGLPILAPRFFDIQINGAKGVGFTSATLNDDGIRTVAQACRDHGIGGFLPTVITSTSETIHHAFRTLAAARHSDRSLAGMIPGFHLEGPFLSPDDGPRGAHPRAFIRDPDFDEFRRWQDSAYGLIRLVTLAPERPGALPLIESLTRMNVVVAIGHTAATGSLIRAAVNAGAKISTHLGNGCHATLPRHDNPIWEQLAEDRLLASVIADGHHLPPAVLKSIVRGKTPQRIILTCDAGTYAGMPPGVYSDWGTDLELLPSGRMTLKGTPYLAGSAAFTDECVRHYVQTCGVSIFDAIEAAAIRPRELMGLHVPRLEVGVCFESFLGMNETGRIITLG
jgi:N-acetylglucosamine-6-phosphate deacetylase